MGELSKDLEYICDYGLNVDGALELVREAIKCVKRWEYLKQQWHAINTRPDGTSLYLPSCWMGGRAQSFAELIDAKIADQEGRHL